MHFIDSFDRIEIINLISRKDRKKQILKQLGRLGYEIDGDRFRLFDAIQPENKGKFPSIGARGCFDSHLNILQQAKKDGVNKLLIIEDDLNFSDDIVNSSKDFYALLNKKNWDFSYLAHTHESIKSFGESDLVQLEDTASMSCTHLIGVSGALLPDLVDYLEKMSLRDGGDPNGGPMHVDGAYNWYRKDSKCNSVIASPPLGYQRSSRSDIAERKFYDKIPILRNLINFIRTLIK